MMNDTDRLHDKLGNSFCIAHNLKGSSIDSWEKQLKENETQRKQKRSNSVYFTHEILSWHKDDSPNITLEKMEKITREYIQLRNPRGIYVAVPHHDKNHLHVHVLVSGIEHKSGKTMRMSIDEMQKLKKDVQLFQQVRFPEFSKSIVEHGRKQKSIASEKEYQLKYRTGRATEKEKVIAKINECYNKADSKEKFFKLLNEHRLKTYERGGKMAGVQHGKYKFRFNRLGFPEMKLDGLEMPKSRKEQLQQVRKRVEKKRNVER
jgi:hypothetical protein